MNHKYCPTTASFPSHVEYQDKEFNLITISGRALHVRLWYASTASSSLRVASQPHVHWAQATERCPGVFDFEKAQSELWRAMTSQV